MCNKNSAQIETVEIELRSCFINADSGDVTEVMNASAQADVFSIYTGSPGFFQWCADFLECEHARLFAETLEKHFTSSGVPTLNRVKS
jgi:hypothetical protein